MATPSEPGVVLITMNRQRELDRTLTALEALPTRHRTVVVDNASTDETPRVVAGHPSVESIRLTTNLGAAARNIGVDAVGTEFVAFLDDDTWPEPDAWGRAVAFLERHPSVAIVTGRMVVGDDDRPDPTCEDMARSPLGRLANGFFVAGFLAGASVVRADAFRAVGGFHDAFGVGGEEQLAAWDLLDRGWSIVYLPDVVIHHHPSPQRDPRQRQLRERRNRVWTAWLRRPGVDVVAQTRRELHEARETRTTARLCAAILRGAPWLVRSRRCMRTSTRELLRRVESASLAAE